MFASGRGHVNKKGFLCAGLMMPVKSKYSALLLQVLLITVTPAKIVFDSDFMISFFELIAYLKLANHGCCL